MNNMDLKEMYYKHQILWYRIALSIMVNERKPNKLDMLPYNDKDILNQCYACDFARKIREEKKRFIKICYFCPLDFKIYCDYNTSIYKRYQESTDIKVSTLLAIQIAETPLNAEYVKENLNNDFGRNV